MAKIRKQNSNNHTFVGKSLNFQCFLFRTVFMFIFWYIPFISLGSRQRVVEARAETMKGREQRQ